MVKKTLLLVALLVVMLSLIGCNAAKGLKEDVQFIGDKTLEIVEKD
jgi:predicted small secreted protein